MLKIRALVFCLCTGFVLAEANPFEGIHVAEEIPAENLPAPQLRITPATTTPDEGFTISDPSLLRQGPKASPAPVPLTSNATLFCAFPQGSASWKQFREPWLVSSKFGPVAQVQAKLGIKPDGILSVKTAGVIKNYQTQNGLPVNSCIDTSLWQKLLPGEPIPDYKVRTRAVGFFFEGTDYDHLQIDFGTRDRSGATWGPDGMTLHDGEIQQVLKEAMMRAPEVLKKASAGDYAIVQKLASSNASSGKSYIGGLLSRGGSNAKKNLKALFVRLGNAKEIRDAYDRVADKNVGYKFKPYLALLAQNGGGTEIDYAFLRDLAVQCSNKTRVMSAVRTSASEPARRREIWGNAVVNTLGTWASDRKKRNEFFYKWKDFTSAYGLSDARKISLSN